jgi:REP element-mobilizing transposase RayT
MNELLQKIQSRLNADPLADNLTPLFCETLRWGAPQGLAPRPLPLGQPLGQTLTARPVAQLAGLPVFRVDWPQDRLPGVTARRAVQRALKPVHAEHLLCYVTPDQRQAAFTWARKRADDKIELRTLPYEVGSPARTTLERLAELAFRLDELGPTGQPPITALTDKLNRAFDVEAVTKQFYQELANWFFWASDHVTFPMPEDTPNPDAYKAQSLIRLITRLIFCWFVKQKRLIPEDLFDPTRLATLLKQGSRLATGNNTVFYKAILQNLFFATLNQEMDQRGFRKRNKHPGGRDPHHGITNLYRYEDSFTDPRAFLDLMRGIPFLNGGLFECLDKVYRAEENRPVERIDGFSDHPKNPLRVPDCLFFGEEREVDLSAAYGEARYRRAKVRGLIHIFNRYNFTVTENTPLDQEVALDPELAGKVFENLLAAYNPETATTARKATGSYYTPRPIVDYMVDEALLAYLKTKVEQTFLSVSSAEHAQTGISAPLLITRRNLPHWTKPDAIYWITFRLADALPQDKLRAWKEQRDLWLKHHPEPWSDADWTEYNDRFGKQLDDWLDAGMGSRALARSDVREAVRACLMRFDGERLRIHAAVIMPTHVHALLEPLGEHKLSELMKGIKGASAREANKLLGTSGQFWLDESFDHIVRSAAQYQHFLRYIADNPVKARLRPDEYWLYQPEGATGIPACAPATSSQTTDKNVCATLEQKLRHLLAYNDEPHQFTPAEMNTLIAAIDNLKALDPACGSGAFPMGLLHKLVFILGKLDPHNQQWKQQQIAKASEIPDATVREKALADIEQAFAANELDHGRKLYLIENCIYGVDIQPIAVQIAKVRFFISLIVDQRVDDAKPNRGILSLPNLETKFVAANTLIGIEKPAQQMLRNPQIDAKEAELRRVRERHFTARTPATKARCREQDAKLRAEIGELLRADGFARETTEKLANWNPYDQNASADFFDPEWMFGIKDGFDIVIGNPPYVLLQDANRDEEFLAHVRATYAVASYKVDLYHLFIEKAVRLLTPRGCLSYITPSNFATNNYSVPLRRFLLTKTDLLRVVFFDEDVFQASVNNLVFVAQKGRSAGARVTFAKPHGRFVGLQPEVQALIAHDTLIDDKCLLVPVQSTGASIILKRIQEQGSPLGTIATVNFGMQLRDRDKFPQDVIENPASKADLSQFHRPCFTGKDIDRYIVRFGNRYCYFHRSAKRGGCWDADVHNAKNKILVRQIGAFPEGGIDTQGYPVLNTAFMIVPFRQDIHPHYLLGVLNSSSVRFFWLNKFRDDRKTFPKIKGEYLKLIPVPVIEHKQQAPIISLVERILAAKRANPLADVSAWEREIDERVYRLYGLTPEEIKIVEEGVK